MNAQQTNSKTKKGQVLTPEFRTSFASVFTPRAVLGSTDPKYFVTMLFSEKDPAVMKGLENMKALVRTVLTEKFGPDQAKWPKGMRLPFRKGEEKDYEGYGPDVIFVSASSKMKPGLVDQNVQPILDQNEFYSGCYARATVTCYYYDKAGNKGVAFGLRNIQKIRDGEPFSGKNKPENDFDALAITEETPAATAGTKATDDFGL